MQTYPPKNYSTDNPTFVQENWDYVNESTTYAQLQEIIGNAPETLNSMKELSDAINANPLFGAETVASLSTKANDSAVMHLTQNESVTGTKTFSNVTFTITVKYAYRLAACKLTTTES
jgi:hypothetical protein